MTVRGLTFQARHNKMNRIKEIKKMKMKKTALRALYGALTLSLIILGGCDQATDPDNNKDTEREDLWKDFLYLNDHTRPLEWQHSIDQYNRVYLTFYPNYKVVIRRMQDGQDDYTGGYTATDVFYDGKTIKFVSNLIGTVTKLPPTTYEGNITALHMNIEFSKAPSANFNGKYTATANYIP
jgi:hypothetical protein